MLISLHAWASLGQGGPKVDAARTRAIISDHFCPCQCGTHLPGSDRSPACFGCSVGKAEVTFIRESIAAGRTLREVLVALREALEAANRRYLEFLLPHTVPIYLPLLQR